MEQRKFITANNNQIYGSSYFVSHSYNVRMCFADLRKIRGCTFLIKMFKFDSLPWSVCSFVNRFEWYMIIYNFCIARICSY